MADLAPVKAFVAGLDLPADVKVLAVNHPDLDEVWVHVVGPNVRATVSFCDDDERVYVVVRHPGRRHVAYGSTTDAARLIAMTFGDQLPRTVSV